MPASAAGPRGKTYAAVTAPSSSCHSTQSNPPAAAPPPTPGTIDATSTQSAAIRPRGIRATAGASSTRRRPMAMRRFTRSVMGKLGRR